MARRMLVAEVSGGRVRGTSRLGWMDGVKVRMVRLGWMDGGLGQQRNGGGGCASMRERSERVERPGTYVTE